MSRDVLLARARQYRAGIEAGIAELLTGRRQRNPHSGTVAGVAWARGRDRTLAALREVERLSP